MTLNFFNKPPPSGNPERQRAVQTVRTWLWGRGHLPRDLVAALHTLIPELKDGQRDVEPFE
jgi:hypothetical protein